MEMYLLLILILLPVLLHKQMRHSTDRDVTVSTVYVCFDWCPVIFNTHAILLTKQVSSLSYLKSNNSKKRRIRKTKKNINYDDFDEATTTTTIIITTVTTTTT